MNGFQVYATPSRWGVIVARAMVAMIALASLSLSAAGGNASIQELLETCAAHEVAWLAEQDIPVHAECTVGHILVGLSGLGRGDLRWLCQAIRQAEQAPTPARMRAAVLKHDVGLLRGD